MSCHLPQKPNYNLIADQEEATLKQPEQDVKEETNIPIIIFVVVVSFMVFVLFVVGMLFRVKRYGPCQDESDPSATCDSNMQTRG